MNETKKTEAGKSNKINYVWYVFLLIAFLLVARWYFLMYFANRDQQDPSRFDYKRFNYQN